MAAVGALVRTGLRAGWRSAILFAVLIGLFGGVAMAAVAGARRADSSVDRFLAYNRPATWALLAPEEVLGPDADRIRRLPMVQEVAQGTFFILVTGDPAKGPDLGTVGSFFPIGFRDGREGTVFDRWFVVRGRPPRPDRVEEAAVDESMAARLHLKPGSRFHIWAMAPSQVTTVPPSVLNLPTPTGPSVELTITGILRTPSDLNPVPAQKGVVYLSEDELRLSAAFVRRYLDEIANPGLLTSVQLRPGASPAAFVRAVRALPGGKQATIQDSSDTARGAERARRGVHLIAVALLLFAATLGTAGYFVVGQALARQVQADAVNRHRLVGLGMTGRQLVTAALLRALVPAGVGAGLATAAAVMLSPLLPVGLARQAEVDPGVHADLPVLGTGVIGIVVLVLLRVLVAARHAFGAPRAGRSVIGYRPPPSRIGPVTAWARGSPDRLVAARWLLDRRSRSAAGPSRTALTATVVAVGTVGAALTLVSSLGGLLDSPAAQGWTWDVMVGNPNELGGIGRAGDPLAHEPWVAGYSLVGQLFSPARAGSEQVPLIGVTPVVGEVRPPVLSGRAPVAPDEVALGRDTLRRLGRRVGEAVDLTGPDQHAHRYRIVGQVLLPGNFDSDLSLAVGGVTTAEGLARIDPTAVPTQLAVRYAPGTDRAAAGAALRRRFGPTVLEPIPNAEVSILAGLRELPILLAAMMAVLGAATLGHALLSSARERRQGCALLRAIGLSRRQVAAIFGWQAGAIAAGGLLLGLPLGVLAGRWAWTAVNEGVGSLAGPRVPWMVLGVVAVTAMAFAGLVAVLPAMAAARVRTAVLLRTE
jgi:hypothetical protein